MKRRLFWRWMGLAGLVLASLQPVLAADPFPSRPIRIIVNTAPGGLTDVLSRMVGQFMGEYLKQTVIVENRAGGDGLIGIRAVKSAHADGYTLLATAGTIANQMALRADPGYDLTKDFTGIGIMGRSPFLMVVEPGQPDKTFADFLARAKANPDRMSYASAGVGTVPHFAMEVLMQQTGAKLMHVPYKGNGAAMPDVMSGRVNTLLEAYGSSSGKIKSNQLRALGVTGTARMASLPDVPTIAEQGVPGYSFYTTLYMIAPAGTPKDVVQSLSQALRAATTSKAMTDYFRSNGIEASDLSPEDFNRFMAGEVQQAVKLVTNLGLPKF